MSYHIDVVGSSALFSSPFEMPNPRGASTQAFRIHGQYVRQHPASVQMAGYRMPQGHLAQVRHLFGTAIEGHGTLGPEAAA
jgi:hypothetical protein